MPDTFRIIPTSLDHSQVILFSLAPNPKAVYGRMSERVMDVEKQAGKVALTYDDLQLLEDECARLDADIDELNRKAAAKAVQRDEIKANVSAVRALLDKLAPLRGSRIEPAKQKPPRVVTLPQHKKRRRGSATWMTEIARIIADEREGASYDDLRAGIDLGPLAERLKENDKGMYGGVGKLEAAGELVKHRGRMFSPLMFEDFSRRVAAGEIEDIPEAEATARPSPMADAILAFLEKNPLGVVSGPIVDELLRYPEFSGTVRRNRTAAYNVIKRLEKRGQLIKEGKFYFPSKKNEGASGEPEAPSETTPGGVRTPGTGDA